MMIMPCRSAITALISQEFSSKNISAHYCRKHHNYQGLLGGGPTGRRKALKSLRIGLNIPSHHPRQICYQRQYNKRNNLYVGSFPRSKAGIHSWKKFAHTGIMSTFATNYPNLEIWENFNERHPWVTFKSGTQRELLPWRKYYEEQINNNLVKLIFSMFHRKQSIPAPRL